jgi:hypothetical protein
MAKPTRFYSRRRRTPVVAVGDRLMSLPPELLDNILARLPFEELVGTSGLSRPWRRRWESVAKLDIRVCPGSSSARNARVLRRCAAPVRSLTIRIGMDHLEDADVWLRSLAGKRVEKLDVQMFDPRAAIFGDVINVPLPALNSFGDLVHLNLGGCCSISPAPEGFGGFPKLIKLALNHVRFNFLGGARELSRMISAAPGLRELSLIDVGTTVFYSGSEFRICTISAPNLRVLKLVMLYDNGCRLAGNFPLLEEVAISIQCPLETAEFLKTFRRVSKVRSLSFHTDSDKVYLYLLLA